MTLSEISQAWIRTHGQNLHNANVMGQWFQGLQGVATVKELAQGSGMLGE